MITVLVIDDDEVDAIRVRRMLQGMTNRQYRVEHVDNYLRGLEYIAGQTHDVYLIDHFLGKETGLELIQAARSLGSDQAMILLTGQSSDEIEHKAIEHGASDFLDKNSLTDYLLDRSIRFAFERHQFEQRKLHNDRLITIGTLAASIAHQFNNINTMVSGNLELILRQNKGNPAIAQRIQHALDAIQHSSDISSTLLTFSRIDSGHRAESLLEIAHDVITLLNSDKKQIPVVLSQQARNAFAVVNRNLITQVVLNLCVNARHASDKGEDANIEIDVGTDHKEVYLTVRDNGCGISDEALKHIFTPFYTTKATFSDRDQKTHGTGLGLSLCHRIVSSHAGHIDVESQLHVGTSMRIALPAAQKDQEPSRVTIALDRQADAKEKQIVVIDDEQSICDILHSTFIDEEFNCASFNDPEAGMHYLLEHQVDLITIDQQMPGMSGAQVIERIRSEGPNTKTPIIIISGWISDENRQFAEQHQVETIIEKPFSIDEVLMTVNKTMQPSKA